jgi:ATP-dependent Clp protease ATP-binding subunit ClpA
LKRTIALAKEESHRLGHNFIGSEQLLIGLLGTDGTAQILNQAGVNLEAALDQVEKLIGRGSGFVAVEIPFTVRAKRAIEIAVQAAQGLVLVQPEHLLLGILDTGEGTALKVLENLGVSIPGLRTSALIQIREQKQVQATQQNREPSPVQTSLLPAIPPVKSDAPRSLYATVLPQETGRWVAEVSANGSGLHGPSFRSIGYGDTEYQAIALCS